MRKLLMIGLLGIGLGVGASQAQVVVRIGPPRPLVERRLERPGPGYIWINGYHRWDGRGYVWVPGRWELPPRARARWVEPRWEHRRDGYYFREGRWR